MATRTTTGGRPALYPWAQWLETALTSVLQLRRGVDYDVGTASMIQQLRNAATRLRFHVVIDEVAGGFQLTSERW